MKRRAVLVVEADPEARERIGGWLDGAGYEVLTCPGPMAPDYTCVAGRGGRCALAEGADVVVLDMWLGSSTVMEGTSPDELLAYYLDLDRPVVALSRTGDRSPLTPDERVTDLGWPPRRERLLEAVRAALIARVSGP